MNAPKLDCYRSGSARLILTDPKTKYFAQLNAQVEPTAFNALSIHYPIQDQRILSMMTGRDVPEYMDHLGYDLDITQDDQLVEVGAGLGQFVPLMVENLGSSLKHRPIVIDPVQYDVVKTHLQTILDQFGNERVVCSLEQRIQEFIKRCTILLGSDVLHIRETLGNAIRLHPKTLLGKADAVVGLCGAMIQSSTENNGTPSTAKNIYFRRRKVREMHCLLLKNPPCGLYLGE